MYLSHQIIVGDVVERLAGLTAKSIHMAVCSPPYFNLRDYGAGLLEIGKENDPDLFVVALCFAFRELHRVLRDDGVFFLNLGDTFASENFSVRSADPLFHLHVPNSYPQSKGSGELKKGELCGIPWRVAFALQNYGWHLLQEIIWHKPDVNPEGRTSGFSRDHETVFLFAKGPKPWFNRDALLEPAVYQPKGRNDVTTHRRTVWNRKPTIWSIPTARGVGSHFAAYPVQLCMDCIAAGSSQYCCGWCGTPYNPVVTVERIETRDKKTTNSKYTGDAKKEGRHDKGRTVSARKIVDWKSGCSCPEFRNAATIIDPFSGSGSALIAAKLMGRNGLGIELNPQFAQDARTRIAQG